MPHVDPEAAAAATTALANLAILACGPATAAEHLVVLPHEANVWGLRDAGMRPGDAGLDFQGMMRAAGEGRLKALVIAGDNPLFLAADKDGTRRALERLELLVVADGLLTDSAKLAHVFLPTGHQNAHDGTTVAADRYLGRVRPAVALGGDQHAAYDTLAALASALGAQLPPTAAAAAGTLTAGLPGYRDAVYDLLGNGGRLELPPLEGKLQPVPRLARNWREGITVVTGRTLFTSYEAASIQAADADKLHREDRLLLNAVTAARLGVCDGEELTMATGTTELSASVAISEQVPDEVVYVPLYIQGGLGAAFATPATAVRVGVRTPA